ncbi:MAG: histidine phosphatase family protein [Planctomycetota bacterium]
MATLILIRHGETDWNRDKIFRGRADVPLGDRGRLQAERVAEALKDRLLETIYSSPLLRSVQTAEAIASRHGLPVTKLDAITDIDCGNWQGRSDSEVRAAQPDLHAQWQSAPHKVRFPNGESLDDVKQRALPAALDAATRTGGEIAVVSHRVVIKMIVLGLLGLGNETFWNVRVDTCSLTIFDISERRAVLVRLNDIGHLAGLREEAAADF